MELPDGFGSTSFIRTNINATGKSLQETSTTYVETHNYGIRNRYQKHHQLQGEWTRRLQFPDTRPTQDNGTLRKEKTTFGE
ncbi:hypothetical protein TNCV_4985991 [Trichonephila clavipes]|nr:hypothetical protein TNCV_4985991 [Trichonephila clavipes]